MTLHLLKVAGMDFLFIFLDVKFGVGIYVCKCVCEQLVTLCGTNQIAACLRKVLSNNEQCASSGDWLS